MSINRILFTLSVVVACLLFPFSSLLAIDFPTRPVNIIIGYSAGGLQDTAVRPIIDKLAEDLKVPVIVLNKPGSGSLLAAQFVAKSEPDGYNIFALGTPILTRQTFDKSMSIDIMKDFEPLSLFYTAPMVLSVRADSRFKTIEDLIDFAKKNPGKLSCGTPGVGSLGHFMIEVFKFSAKIDFKHVPFTSDAQSVTAVMGGHIDFATSGLGMALSKLASGDLRLLASYNEERFPEAKDTPTLKEKGYPEAVINTWLAFVVRSGTHKEIIEKLNKAFRAAITDPATISTLKKVDYFVTYRGPIDLRKFLQSELDKYNKLVKDLKISIN